MVERNRLVTESIIPTPTQFVSDLGILAIAPELRGSYSQVFSGVKLGMDLDDFYDFGVQPRPQTNQVHEPNAENSAEAMKYYQRYKNSYEVHIGNVNDSMTESEKTRHARNTRWFVSTVSYLEGESLSRDKDYWNPETVTDYRESVILVWSMFIASLAKKSSVDLYQVANSEGHFCLDNCEKWMNTDDGEAQLEKLYTQRLFFGALVFQVVSDYGKKDFSIDRVIPGFGGIGFENLNDREIKQYLKDKQEFYLQQAINCGVDTNTLKIFTNIFPKIQNILRKIKKSKSMSEWAYS